MQRVRKLSSSITDLLSTRKRGNVRQTSEDFDYSQNPLHLAVVVQDVEQVEYLLRSGTCNIDEEDLRGQTALQLAVLGSSTKLTRLLIFKYDACIDHADFQQTTAAHLIAKHNKIEHCRILLDAGADFVMENKYGKSAVDLACELGNEQLLDLLIEYGCIKEYFDRFSTRLHPNTSALHLAAQKGHVRVCFKLLNFGFNLNMRTNNGSVLHEAIAAGHVQIVRLLLHLGIDHTIRDSQNRCAKTLAFEQSERLSVFGHTINVLMQQYPLRIYGITLEDQFDLLNSTKLFFRAHQQIWVIDRSNHRQWKGIVFGETGESQCGFFEPHRIRIERIVSNCSVHFNNLPSSLLMPSLRSVKDANGRMTARRIKRVEMPKVPDVPGMQEELNRRRSRHLSNGNIPELFGHNAIEMSNHQADYQRAPSAGSGSFSRTSSNCGDQPDLYTFIPANCSSQNQNYNTINLTNSLSLGMPTSTQRSMSTFQQQTLQQNHRNSTGSSSTTSSQASSGFESLKTLNNLANSNSSSSFNYNLSTSDNLSPSSLGVSCTDTLRRPITINSNRHSTAGSDTSSQPRSQCTHLPSNSPQINIAEMISRGIPDSEILGEWLEKMGMQKYLSLFITQGYDVPSVARLTSEDLLALGISDPTDRRRLYAHIQEWSVNDTWPSSADQNDSAAFWLVTIGLQQYVRVFESEGYIQIKDLENLSFEELEDMGIKKLGHIKRICLALKKLKQHRHQFQAVATSSVMSIPPLAACVNLNQQKQQQFHSPDSGFTENASIFSTIQRPRLSSQPFDAQKSPNDPYFLVPPIDTPILDDLLEKPTSKLQIYSTRQIFAEQSNPHRYEVVPPLQLNRRHSPPPPAPVSQMIKPHALTARPSFAGVEDFRPPQVDLTNANLFGNYERQGVSEEWRHRNGTIFRSQPPTPIRQQQSLSSFTNSNAVSNFSAETSFALTGMANELNAIQMAK